MSLTFPEEAGSTRRSRKSASSIHPELQPNPMGEVRSLCRRSAPLCPASAAAGRFTNLNANIKLTKYYYGSMEMLGKGNVVDWGGFNRLAVSPQDKQYHVMQLK
jgi:hypothetical protein